MNRKVVVSVLAGSVSKTYSLTGLSFDDVKEVIDSLSERGPDNGNPATRDKLVAELHTALALGGDFIPIRSSSCHERERNGETGQCPE